jgi:hypothetical protein
MTQRYSLIVTAPTPLITLAAADSLDLLLNPGVPVFIPDGVHWEAVCFPSMPGAADIVDWLQKSRKMVHIEATQEFANSEILRESGRRVRGMGERCALELVNLQSKDEPGSKPILLYEDSDVVGLRLLQPEDVDTLTTADFLHVLEDARLIQSADHILDLAVAAGRTEHVRTRTPNLPPHVLAQLRDDRGR